MSVCHRERGAALIMVLWVALLLSAILGGAVAAARGEAKLAAARTEKIKAHEAARAALELAAYTTALTQKEFSLSGRIISLNGYDVKVDPALESKKLDINLAPESVLRSFFTMLGADPEEAATIAARIADWRDTDDLVRPNGAEKPDYAVARHGEKIGNRIFYSVKELDKVLGMPDDLLACAAPALTVLGDDGLPDAQFLQDLYKSSINLPQRKPSARLATSGTGNNSINGRRFVLTAIARKDNGYEFGLTGLFRITGGETLYEFIAVFPKTYVSDEVDCKF